MTNDEFNARMAIGYAQAKADLSAPADEVFQRLIEEIVRIPAYGNGFSASRGISLFRLKGNAFRVWIFGFPLQGELP